MDGLATGAGDAEGRPGRRGGARGYLSSDEEVGTAGVAGIPIAPKPEGTEGPLAPEGVREPPAGPPPPR